MKKRLIPLISLMLSALLCLSACGGTAPEVTDTTPTDPSPLPATDPATEPAADPVTEPATTPEIIVQEKQFDENDVVFSFAAISDVHITWGKAQFKLTFPVVINALLSEAAKLDANGLDAVVIAGDNASNNSKKDEHAKAEIERFAILVKEQKNTSVGTNFLVTTGNHDTRSEHTSLSALYNTYLGAEYFAMDVENDLEKGYRHSVINGYHFIMAEPLTTPVYGTFGEEVLEWIDRTLEKIISENPEQYVFFVTHPTVANTVYGSEDDHEPGHNRWRSTNLGAILEKYPQVIAISGHTHDPLIDERCIMQTEFTSINVGSISNTSVEIDKYDNMSDLPTIDNSYVGGGTLIQIDGNGNVRISRYLFKYDTESKKASLAGEIKSAWELNHPTSDGSHLTAYTRAEREKSNSAPTMSGEITVNVNKGDMTADIVFPAGKDDDFVHHYIITVEELDTGKTVFSNLALTDFFSVTDASDMLEEFKYTVRLEKGSCRISVTAVDSWNAESNTLTATVSVN